MSAAVAFVDIDNTLLDHDRLKVLTGEFVERVRPGGAARFWDAYEAVREETGIADLPETARRFGDVIGDSAAGAAIGEWLWDVPMTELVYPGTARALSRLAETATPVIVCDGSDAYQRHKVATMGFGHLFGERVHVFVHKEQHFAELAARYPAARYLVLDDKPRIHRAARAVLGARVTTVLLLQGHYAAATPAHTPFVDIAAGNVAEAIALLYGVAAS